jgi:uncharacterized protein
MPAFAFGGHEFIIIGKTALFWPARGALIVADLHLEKASWFAARGQMLPPYDSQATLDRLGALIDASGAKEVWCLGDNFHDEDGPGRLSVKASAQLVRLTQSCDWRWITGNHDETLPAYIGGTIMEEAEVDGLILRHRALLEEVRPELSGHFHPKVRASAKGRGVTRACFVRGTTKLIFPSFGAFTGGMAAGDAAIVDLVGQDAKAIVESGGQMLILPLDTQHRPKGTPL